MADRREDKWLNVFCPDDACLTDEEHMALPTSEQAKTRSDWQELFCPQESCEVTSATQLP
jgi:hypothetical protein